LAPENGWDWKMSLSDWGRPSIFRCELAVSLREGFLCRNFGVGDVIMM